MTFEYGVMSSLYSCEAENKFIAYATMCIQFTPNANLLVVYKPTECINDNWMSYDGKIAKILDEIFSSEGGFEKYVKSHMPEIKLCYKSIKRLI
jgi:hypothetical protein